MCNHLSKTILNKLLRALVPYRTQVQMPTITRSGSFSRLYASCWKWRDRGFIYGIFFQLRQWVFRKKKRRYNFKRHFYWKCLSIVRVLYLDTANNSNSVPHVGISRGWVEISNRFGSRHTKATLAKIWTTRLLACNFDYWKYPTLVQPTVKISCTNYVTILFLIIFALVGKRPVHGTRNPEWISYTVHCHAKR